jgi:hypothetical protein
MMQTDSLVNRCAPRSCIERKPRHSALALRYRRQLEKVARDDQLNTTKWPAIVAYLSGDGLQLIEQVAINHGYFINDQDLGSHPSVLGLLVPLDLAHQLGYVFFAKTDTCKAVECHAADVARCQSS